MRKLGLALAIAASAILVACGGGGGGGATTSTTVSNIVTRLDTFFSSYNLNATTSTVQNFPNTGLNYATAYFGAGHFGSPTAECYVEQTQERGPSGSSLSLTDAPAYVYCAQSDGTVKEVSAAIFGSQIMNMQGEYPVIADLNHDGIDDLFLLRQCDCGDTTTQAEVFISQPNGSYVSQVLAVPAGSISFTAGTQFTALDFSGHGGGCLDIAGPKDYVFVNPCNGTANFTATTYSDSGNNTLHGYDWATASCAADFDGSGVPQILFTDALAGTLGNGNFPNAIVKFNASRQAVSNYKLSPTYFNTLYNDPHGAHIFACRVADINNDGKPDIILYTSNYYMTPANGGTATAQSYVQVYRNDSTIGNPVFTDISATALPGQVLSGGPAYSPRMVDLNGDGYLDMALDGPTYGGTANANNQVWINNKNGTFTPVFQTELTTIFTAYANQFGGLNTNGNEVDSMFPIKVNGKWNYLVQLRDKAEVSHVGVANTQLVFK